MAPIPDLGNPDADISVSGDTADCPRIVAVSLENQRLSSFAPGLSAGSPGSPDHGFPDLEFGAAVGLCRRNALHVVRLAWRSRPDVGFDVAGVRWLDEYLDQSRATLTVDLAPEFAQLMGCFYGECVIETFAGSWEQVGDRLAVRTEQGLTYPFHAVARQLAGDGVSSIAEAFLTAAEYLSDAA